jgi:hypothetical protein
VISGIALPYRTDHPFLTNRNVVFSLALFCCALWGSSYPAIKNGYALFGIAAGDIPSKLVFAGWRFFLAGLLLLVYALLSDKRIGGFRRASWASSLCLASRRRRCSTCSFTSGWPTPPALRVRS